ncbi:hypothetical protein pdam_00024011, partial [Pocillopora damicornis]
MVWMMVKKYKRTSQESQLPLLVSQIRLSLEEFPATNSMARYLKKDPRIRSGAVFVGACPDSTKVIYLKSQ